MDVAQIRALKPRLDDYLACFEDCFSRCDTREHLAVYIRGQLSDLAQKSVEPMALAVGMPPRTLQEFLARYKWDEDALRRRLHGLVARDHACPQSIGLIDETSDTKKGVQTPGVQRQRLSGSEPANPHGHGFIAAISWKRAGNVTTRPARAITTRPMRG